MLQMLVAVSEGKQSMRKVMTFALIAVALTVVTSAEAQNRQGRGTGPESKRACRFQVCFDRCIANGGLRGSPLSQRHCGNFCARHCPQS
jgi:hypothetical protein